jgi:hypothetical protein
MLPRSTTQKQLRHIGPSGIISLVKLLHHRLLLHQLFQALLLLLGVDVVATAALPESRFVLSDDQLDLVLVITHALELAVKEFFGVVGIAEANSDNTLRLLIVDGAVSDVTPLFCGLGHVFLDFAVNLVVLNLLEGEDVLDDDDFAPLVLLGSVNLGNFFFVIGPFSELSARLLVMNRNIARFSTRTG